MDLQHEQPKAPETRTISLATPYGEVVVSEQVAPAEFPSALRRFRVRALQRANAVVVLDGVVHTRNAFLELVRHFNDCTARAAAHG
jgi:hypothetical protein